MIGDGMRDNTASEQNLKSLFISSLEFSDELARKRFLDDQCGDDLELRIEVERLLAVQETTTLGPLDRATRWLEPFRLDAQFEDSNPDCEFRLETTIGPYQLLERIGEGGMGTVYRARQSAPVNRDVALKLIKPGMDSREVLARFDSELQTLAMMQHPNIASVFDAGMTSQGRPYFVMELVCGLAIDKYCDEAQISFFTRLQLFVSVCRAIQHAHDKQIVHRDLKPSNVLILAQDGEPVVKVIDFGIAKALSAGDPSQTRITEFARLVGTPLYMSPEQANHGDNPMDTRSDIYSLGVLLYKLVTGVTPVDRSVLQGEGIERVKKLICEEPAQRPSQRLSAIQDCDTRPITGRQIFRSQELSNKVRRELDWIILRALEKNREHRYQSAADFADDIGRFINNEPVHACPPTLAYRTQKALQKYRWRLGIAAAFALILLVTGAISLGLYFKASQAARISQLREQRAYDFHESNVLQSALTALAQHDLASMKSRLDEYRSLTVPRTDRSSPDSHSLATLLKQLADPQPRLLIQHSTEIRDITFPKDATQAFAVDADGQLLSASLDGQETFTILGNHLARGDSVAVSPDGRQAVTGSLTGQVWLWDLATGKVLREFDDLAAGVETLVWSADGKTIAAGARYSGFCVYRADGTELFRHANDHRHESILFSLDSTQLYVPTRKCIEVWDMASQQLSHTLDTDPISNVRSLCWAGPDSRWLVAGERNSEALIVIDVEARQTVGSFHTNAEYACSLAGSPDGRWLAAAYANGRIQLIQLSESRFGEVYGEVKLRFAAHEYSEEANRPMTVQWLDSDRFLSAAADGSMKVWDRLDLEPRVSPSSRLLFGAYWTPGQRIARLFAEDQYAKSSVFASVENVEPFTPSLFSRVSVDGRIAAGGRSGLGILDVNLGQWLTCFEPPFFPHYVKLSPDSKYFVSASDVELVVWQSQDNWKTHQQVRSWEFGTSCDPIFADDCRTLIVHPEEQGVVLELDIASGHVSKRTPFGIGGNCALSPDSRLLAMSAGGGIRVLDRATDEVVFQANDVSRPQGFLFFDDARILISGHLNGSVHAWHLPTSQSLGQLFELPEWLGRPMSFQLSPEGTGLIIWNRNSYDIKPAILGKFDSFSR